MAPPARCLIVERVSEDVFRIIWWDRDCKRREELATKRSLTDRCNILTLPGEYCAVDASLEARTPNNLRAPAGNTKDVSDSTHGLISQDLTCGLSGMEHAP